MGEYVCRGYRVGFSVPGGEQLERQFLTKKALTFRPVNAVLKWGNVRWVDDNRQPVAHFVHYRRQGTVIATDVVNNTAFVRRVFQQSVFYVAGKLNAVRMPRRRDRRKSVFARK